MSTRRIRRTSMVLAACLIVSVVAATGATARDRTSDRATRSVRAVATHWSPATVRISTGDVIKWRGVSGTHTVTAYGRGWTFNKDLSTGDVEDRTFRRAGTFKFRCTFHSSLANGQCTGMCGKVVVRS